MDKLLQEAIADAKAVRETALANAKLALEEAFTPHLKSMLSKKLQAEMEGEDEESDDPVEEEMDTSGIGASDNKEPDAAASEADSQGPEEEGAASEAGAEDENNDEASDQAMGENMEPGHEDEDAEEAPDQAMGEQEEPEGEEQEEQFVDEDLEQVLRQLEQEMGMEDEEGEEEIPEPEIAAPAEQEEPIPGMEDEDDEEAAPEIEMEAEDEDDIDLEEIIKALSEEGEDEEAEAPVEEQEDEDDPAAELEEYKQTVQYLRGKLQEVNLLNAKLLYTNKLFRSRNISESQKMKVIEQFDRAANVREVKLVYTTFAESMKRKAVNESASRKGQASKPVSSTKSRKPIIGEQVDFQTRMKKLANII